MPLKFYTSYFVSLSWPLKLVLLSKMRQKKCPIFTYLLNIHGICVSQEIKNNPQSSVA